MLRRALAFGAEERRVAGCGLGPGSRDGAPEVAGGDEQSPAALVEAYEASPFTSKLGFGGDYEPGSLRFVQHGVS